MKILALILLFSAARLDAQVAVVAHQGVPADTLSSERLLDLYTGDAQTWDGGQTVVPLDLKERTPVKEAFYKFLGKSPSRMKSIWLKRLLSGEGEPPEAFASEEALLKKIADTPGAIGYALRDKVGAGVKVLAVIDLKSD